MKAFIIDFFDKQKLTSKLHKQITLFLIIGAFCFFIDISLLAVFVEIIKFGLVLSTALSFIIVAHINYLLSIKYIFINGKYEKKKEVSGFLIIAVVAFVLNLILIKYFTNVLGIHYLISKIITVLFVSVVTFSLKKWILFIK